MNEVRVKEGDWLAGKRLRDCRLPEEGVSVLGIYRADGAYLGVPRADTDIYAGDTLVLYGRSSDLRELTFRRDGPSGQKAHEKAVDDQKSHEDQQARQDRATAAKRRGSPQRPNRAKRLQANEGPRSFGAVVGQIAPAIINDIVVIPARTRSGGIRLPVHFDAG